MEGGGESVTTWASSVQSVVHTEGHLSTGCSQGVAVPSDVDSGHGQPYAADHGVSVPLVAHAAPTTLAPALLSQPGQPQDLKDLKDL